METGKTRKFRFNPSSPWATIIGALITATFGFFGGIYLEYFKTKETILCEKIKEDAENYAFVINTEIKKIKDDNTKLITYAMWRDKFKEISNYDCAQINIQFEKIINFYKESGKALDL